MGRTKTLVWYRGKDLRVADHAPLAEAAKHGDVIPVFVMSPRYFDRPGELPHRMQFLLACLEALRDNLAHLGSGLVLVRGPSRVLIPELVRRWEIDRVVAHRASEPFGRKRDNNIEQRLNVPFDLFEGETLCAPGSLRTKAGTPFSVFSYFARAFRAEVDVDEPLPTPKALPAVPSSILNDSVQLPSLGSLGIKPNKQVLPGGERAARQRLSGFLQDGARDYDEARDRMDLPGTSRLSQDLKFGTLSIRTVWNAASRTAQGDDSNDRFLTELLWREFSHHSMWDRPSLLQEPFRQDFQEFPWEDDEAHWQAWVAGETGYPIVDAAARQLLGEGFVHNRARMISASFLTKHLLTDYRKGEQHYMRFLTDGDWAQNNLGWQWSAGCGCDAQPYFRIFNPMTQGHKFDPEGTYVRSWVPELKNMPTKFIHRPWEASAEVLEAAGVVLGETYPAPIVDHRTARQRFLFVAENHLSAQKKSRASGSGQRPSSPRSATEAR